MSLIARRETPSDYYSQNATRRLHPLKWRPAMGEVFDEELVLEVSIRACWWVTSLCQ